MKKLSLFFICLSFMFSVTFLQGQTLQQIQEITKDYDQSYLRNQSQQLLQKSQADKDEAIRFANARNLPVSYTTKDGGFSEIQRVSPDGLPIYYRTFNADAAKSTRANHLNTGGSTGFNLNGQNMTAYVWDGGHPRTSHQEYGGRVSVVDGPLDLNFHAAHVAGTIAASGVQPQAKGMAPQSSIRAYNWTNDVSEATTAAGQGMLLSNHSYGLDSELIYDAGSSYAWYFGAYMQESRSWDNLMFNADHYLMVVAAGNDGADTYFNRTPLQNGYDMLTAAATSKNNLVVANGQDANIDSNGNLISFPGLDPSSSPGPTDDLRIKPDITGNGYYVYSTLENHNSAYGTLSGTSMAAPNVTGSLLLLQEHYHNLNDSYMKAATLKGLALHTADDIGPAGPDSKHGWGLLNSKRAAETITNNGVNSIVEERSLAQGQTITIEVDADGINDLQASISWTDHPGVAKTTGPANSGTKALVNDLDIRITKGSSTYYPWRLTSATANSNSGDNSVDPYERIDISNASGTYTITITHKGTLQGGSQNFSLIVTGIAENCQTAQVPQNITIGDITYEEATVNWTGSESAFDLRYRITGQSTWTTVSDIEDTEYTLTNLNAETEYDVQVRSKCSETNSEYSSTEIFTTLAQPNSYECNQEGDDFAVVLNDLDLIYADDLVIDSETIFNLEEVVAYVAKEPYFDFTDAYLYIYKDNNGKPGSAVNISTTPSVSIVELGQITVSKNYYLVSFVFEESIVLSGEESEAYWIGISMPNTRTAGFITGSLINGNQFHVSPDNGVSWIDATYRYSGVLNNNIDLALDFYGQCEDIIVDCTRPTDLAIDSLSSTSVTFSWEAGDDETSWNISWGPLDYEPGDSNEIGTATVSTMSYEITGLDASSDYDVYVQSDCGSGDLSSWSGPISFSTLCAAQSVPYLLDFETGSECVTIENAGTGNNWGLFNDEFIGFEGVWAAYEYNPMEDANAWLYTAAISLEAGVDYEISYKYGSAGYDESMKVAMGTENSSAAMTTILADHPLIKDSPLYNTVTFTVPADGVYFFGFNAYSEADQHYLLLDDIAIDAVSSPDPISYYLITAANQLEAGEKYLIVNANEAGEAKALSHQTNNNRSSANITITQDGGNLFISTDVAQDNTDQNVPYLITLGEGNEYWTLFDEVNNGFLYAASNSANHLKNRAANSDLNSEWDITIAADGVATIKAQGNNGRNWLRYNSGANLFAAYSSGQQHVYIYKAGPAPVITDYVYEDGIWTPENPSGVATEDDNITVINGATTLSGITTGKDITINAGATLNMEGVLNLYGDLTIEGTLVFKSSATGNGELGHVAPTSTITGNAVVENFMDAHRSYRMLTSAVTTTGTIKDNWQEGVNNTSTETNENPNPNYGTHITGSIDGSNGFDATISGNSSLFTLDTELQDWTAVSNTDVNTLSAGTPYLLFVRGDRSIDLGSNASVGSTVIRATGALHTGNQTQNFTRDGADSYFAMFGNPYQSAVDMKQVLNGANASNVNTEHYYVYDPSIGVNGSYVTISLGDPVSSVPASAANEFLQPGQAAQFATDGGGASSITFTENAKSPGNFTNTSAAPVSSYQHIRAQLYTASNYTTGGKPYDGFVMLFDINFDNALTASDAQKPLNFRENIGIDHDGTLLSIERREMPIASEVYQLFTSGYSTSDYTLSFALEGLEDIELYLDDAYTGSSTLLTAEAVYSFSVNEDEASRATDRFVIRVESSLGIADNALSGIRLFPNPLNAETFYIHAPKLNGEQVEINIADMAGRQIFNNTLSCVSNKITVDVNDTLASGVYLVTVKFAGEIQTYRLVRE